MPPYSRPDRSRMSGIPKSFMMHVDKDEPGARLTPSGHYVMPKIDKFVKHIFLQLLWLSKNSPTFIINCMNIYLQNCVRQSQERKTTIRTGRESQATSDAREAFNSWRTGVSDLQRSAARSGRHTLLRHKFLRRVYVPFSLQNCVQPCDWLKTMLIILQVYAAS